MRNHHATENEDLKNSTPPRFRVPRPSNSVQLASCCLRGCVGAVHSFHYQIGVESARARAPVITVAAVVVVIGDALLRVSPDQKSERRAAD